MGVSGVVAVACLGAGTAWMTLSRSARRWCWLSSTVCMVCNVGSSVVKELVVVCAMCCAAVASAVVMVVWPGVVGRDVETPALL